MGDRALRDPVGRGYRWLSCTGRSASSCTRNANEFNFVIRNAALLLVVVGAISTIVFRSDLSSRADGGQGLLTLLKTCLAVACVYLPSTAAFIDEPIM